MKYILPLFLTIIFIPFISAQRIPNVAGKCYAQCRIPDKIVYVPKEVYLYTGIDTSNEQVALLALHYCEAIENPTNPNIPAYSELVQEERWMVLDTNAVKDFETFTIYEVFYEKSEQYMEWKEVICDADVTKKLIRKLKQALKTEGYDIDMTTNEDVVPMEVKRALVEFQKKNNLPVGALDMESAKMLGILNK